MSNLLKIKSNPYTLEIPANAIYDLMINFLTFKDHIFKLGKGGGVTMGVPGDGCYGRPSHNFSENDNMLVTVLGKGTHTVMVL